VSYRNMETLFGWMEGVGAPGTFMTDALLLASALSCNQYKVLFLVAHSQ